MASRNVVRPETALARTQAPLGGWSSEERRARSVKAADGLTNVVAGLNTSRDKSVYSSYVQTCSLQRYELDAMFRSDWLAKKIVVAKANDMTRRWRRHVFADDNQNQQLNAVRKYEKDFQVQAKFDAALCWARLYGGTLILLGLKGQPDLSQPLLVESVRKGDLQYLHVLDRWRCSSSGTLVMDLTSPNFGLPEFYLVAESSVRVHHTRVLRFNGEKLPYFSWQQNGMWDDSVLQHVYDALRQCGGSTAALATMMFESNVDVISGSSIGDTLAAGGDSLLTKRFQTAMLMKSFNRTLLLDEDEKYEKKSNSFANLDKVTQTFFLNACGAAGYPYSRLFGQSPGGLSTTGDGDLSNYYDHVHSLQESDLRPQLEYFDQVMLRSALGTYPEDASFEWESLWQTDDKDQADIDLKNAQRDHVYLTDGVVTEGLVASELQARGTYRSMSAEDVLLAEELAQTPDPTPTPPALTPMPQQQAGGVEQTTELPKPNKALVQSAVEKRNVLVARDEDEHWVTLENGVHIELDGEGNVTKGPQGLSIKKDSVGQVTAPWTSAGTVQHSSETSHDHKLPDLLDKNHQLVGSIRKNEEGRHIFTAFLSSVPNPNYTKQNGEVNSVKLLKPHRAVGYKPGEAPKRFGETIAGSGTKDLKIATAGKSVQVTRNENQQLRKDLGKKGTISEEIHAIPMSQINSNQSFIFPAQVANYAASLSTPNAKTQAGVVRKEKDGSYTLLDGNHRMFGAEIAGYSSLGAHVYTPNSKPSKKRA